MIDDHVQENIKALRPYQPGMTMQQLGRQYGIAENDIIKLASNENPASPSPRVAAAVTAAMASANRYPDQFELTDALAKKYGLKNENIIIGNGSNDVLDLIARVFLGPDTEAVSSQYGFQIYGLLTKLMNAQNVVAPALNYGHDLDAMAKLITDKTRIVWIANPNNPTGTFNGQEKLLQFLATTPPDVVVVLDEAYYEYLSKEDHYDSVAWLERFPNLVIVRTFSKAYGIAGLRVGYGIGNAELIGQLQKVRQPFNVSSPALAGAVAALEDQEFLETTLVKNREGIVYLTSEFDRLGIEYVPSYTNFVTAIHPKAQQFQETLLERGIIVRPLVGDGLPNCFRCSVGLPEENRRLVAELESLL